MKPYIILIILSVFILSCRDDDPAATTPTERGIEETILPLTDVQSLDTLIQEIGDATYVLLGESSHGTAEFYEWRAEISKRLIQERGFNIIVVEGDWPDLYRLNEYINGSNIYGSTSQDVLGVMDRWPTWMWANEEVASFAEWLRIHNSSQDTNEGVNFYGMDVYSLWDSMREVLRYLETVDPDAAEQARRAISCFAPYESQDEWAYAQAKQKNGVDCADELQQLLTVVQENSANNNSDAAFNALQNATVALNAERYYSSALTNDIESWNIRDHHMVQTISELSNHHGGNAKIIIWAHNTHVGDARATNMQDQGMVNVGQLLREQHGEDNVYIIGLGTYQGSVIASSVWGSSVRNMDVPPAKASSWEGLLHRHEPADKIILLDRLKNNSSFTQPIGHRAIGVVYDPENEQGNYVPSVLPERYDAFLFIDRTEALHPLGRTAGRKQHTGRSAARDDVAAHF